jgi:hypothetical protein
MPRRHFASARCAAATVVLFCAALSPDARADFQPGEFITYSQDSWGATPSPGNGAQLLAENFGSLYGGGVEVGISGNAGFSMIFTSVASVLNYLPSSGAPAPLNADHIDPTSTSSGLLGGWVLALQFNVDFTDAGIITGSASIPFGDLILYDLAGTPLFNGLSVRQFLTGANQFLGGSPPPYTYDDIAALTDDLTVAFEGGTPSQFAQDHLAVPEPSAAGVAVLAMMLVRRRVGRRSAAA